MTAIALKEPTKGEKFAAIRKAYYAKVREHTTTLPEFPNGKRWTQVTFKIHPSTWYLLPFAINADVPGLYHVEWLCFSLRITWKTKES